MKRRALPAAAALAAVSWLSAAPAAAENRLEKDLKLDPGGEFRLETDIGAVTVKGSPDSGAHVVVTSRGRDLDDLLVFRFEEGAGSARVIAKKKHHSWFTDHGDRVQYEVRVPADTRVSVDTSGGGIQISGLRGHAKLETSGGGIRVEDLSGDLDANTSGGSIQLAGVKGAIRVETSGGGIDGRNLDGTVHAESSGGSIELEKVTGDLDAQTSGGGIRIVDAGGRVHADTSGGSIEASFTKGNSKGGTLETSGGGIEVSLDPDADLSIQASGNSVKTDLPLRVQGEISRGSLSGSLGKGGNTLRLHTSGGSVRIQGL